MKKYLWTLFCGFALFLVGVAIFCIETVNFKVDNNLTAHFTLEENVTLYKINDEQTYQITNLGTNKNMNLYIDNSLQDEIKIVVLHSEMLKVESKLTRLTASNKDVTKIDIATKANCIEFDEISNLYKLGVASLRDKTIYNYSLLKYPEIRVFVNERYREKVEFIDNYGTSYNPIR